MITDTLFEKHGRVCIAGTVVFRQGEPGGSMYVIRSGKVRLVSSNAGRERVVAVLGPGEFFGEMAVVRRGIRTATATVIEHAELLKVHSELLEEMIKRSSEIAVRLIQRLADRLDFANHMIDALLYDNPTTKLVASLYNHAIAAQDSGQDTVDLDSETLAGQIGVHMTDAERALRRLERLGLIEASDPGNIRIVDVAKLQQFLQFLQKQDESES